MVGAHLRGELLLLLLHAHRVGVVLHARAVEGVVELAYLALVLLEHLGLLRARRVQAAQLLPRVLESQPVSNKGKQPKLPDDLSEIPRVGSNIAQSQKDIAEKSQKSSIELILQPDSVMQGAKTGANTGTNNV